MKSLSAEQGHTPGSMESSTEEKCGCITFYNDGSERIFPCHKHQDEQEAQ